MVRRLLRKVPAIYPKFRAQLPLGDPSGHAKVFVCLEPAVGNRFTHNAINVLCLSHYLRAKIPFSNEKPDRLLLGSDRLR